MADMMATFVIALRHGVEVSLIVGIVAAFLGQNGRRDAQRWVFVGVVLASALCLAGGIALRLFEQKLYLPASRRGLRPSPASSQS
jgi:high-affinity iron transporter